MELLAQGLPNNSATVIFGIVCGLLGVLAGAAANIYSAKRSVSYYRTRLKADLEILEKAKQLELDTSLVRARIQQRLNDRYGSEATD
jgi:hypothetical protein